MKKNAWNGFGEVQFDKNIFCASATLYDLQIKTQAGQQMVLAVA